jgi:peroxiredoxin
MAVESSMTLAPGSALPDFCLPDVVTGALVRREDFSATGALLIIFLCRHCPYVVHVLDELRQIVREFQPQGLVALGISANDPVQYPDDAPEQLARMVEEENLPFPVLFDESQNVARVFSAVCTPDFFLFDGAQKLFYRGRMDDSTPGNGRPVTGADLRGALKALLAGESAPAVQEPSRGCSIKWK